MPIEEIQESGSLRLCETVRRANPLVGSITNTVTINLVAHAQLARQEFGGYGLSAR